MNTLQEAPTQMLKLSVYLREGLVCQLAELKDILHPGGLNET